MLRFKFFLIAIICNVISANPFPRQCEEDKPCVAIANCNDFSAYININFKLWPSWVKNKAKTHLCDVKVEGGSKIFSVCCEQPFAFEARFSNSDDKVLNGEDCGKHSSDRIAHGANATVFEYPWMALLQDIHEKFVCGGTLITKWHVLTAAHCKTQKLISVRLGENDLSKHKDCNDEMEEDCSDPVQDIMIAKFIPHELYSPAKKKNDIALVRLVRPARFCDSVVPICLPLEESQMPSEQNLQSMIVTGWGATENNFTSAILQFAKLPVYPVERCSDKLSVFKAGFTLDDSYICTLSKNKIDHCRGDSGGPLQYISKETNQFYQYGIVAFGGKTCGDGNIPSVYTNVPYFIDWIRSKLDL